MYFDVMSDIMGRQGSETRTPFALALCPKNVAFLFYLHEFANILLVGHTATAMTGFWNVDTFSDNTMLRFHCYKNEYGEQCKSCILKQGSVATLRDSITCVSINVLSPAVLVCLFHVTQ